MKSFQILVLGGGHAGVEAAQIASQFGLNVAIVTLPGIGLASAPCNPSIGGVGKGQVVREIDALGGVMGRLADHSGIQFRTLNDSKGYAVRSSRAQIDKDLYSATAEALITEVDNIEVIRDKVTRVFKLPEGFEIVGENCSYRTTKLIVTVGTFLAGRLHTGSEQTEGGRFDGPASHGLEDLFSGIEKASARFKTGTPPRLAKESINYQVLEEQPSDSAVRNFHLLHHPFQRKVKQVSCYLARTNQQTMNVIRENKDKSPLYNGQITGIGARYCPSIEDKAYRYPDKHIHHVFIEPEGLDCSTMYPSGISSSLPKEVQLEYVRSIEGLESAEIEVFGYAVEYDVIDTTRLGLTLEHKSIPGLYFAGQVNGTSGYEEAAGQGLVAGANAALALTNRNPLILSRNDSYIGVMIEDLVSNMRDEPYRLFTSRSENRLYIREDNTALRIYPYRTAFGLNLPIDDYLNCFADQFSILSLFLDNQMLSEDSSLLVKFSGSGDSQKLNRRISLSELLKQAWVDPVEALILALDEHHIVINEDLLRCLAISKKYEGYIKRYEDQNLKIQHLDRLMIDWEAISRSKNISFECRQRISRIQPQTFGQLKQIEGIRPATLAVVASRAL